MADHATYHVTSIKFFAGIAKYALQVDVVDDEISDPLIIVTVCFIPFEEAFYLVIEEVAKFFEDGYRVGSFLWVLTQFDQLLEELIDIGQVEITRKDKVAGDPIIEPDERMASLNGVIPVSPVSQVAHQDLTGIGFIILKPLAVTELFRS